MDADAADARVRELISGFGPTIVAYSGGVDSTVVAEIANDVLGRDRCMIATAASASLASYELEAALQVARDRGWNLELVATQEFEDDRYTANAGDRCFFCKTELYAKLSAIAVTRGYSVIANGANLDDRGDYRPGMRAAEDFSVRSPLLEAGLGKDEVRALARRYSLPNWDKPAQPCLSSRVPYGTQVSPQVVGMIAQSELRLRNLGFTECRVRHYGTLARVEVPLDRIDELRSVWDQVTDGLLAAGYASVELEERGLKSGRLNEVLSQPVVAGS